MLLITKCKDQLFDKLSSSSPILISGTGNLYRSHTCKLLFYSQILLNKNSVMEALNVWKFLGPQSSRPSPGLGFCLR